MRFHAPPSGDQLHYVRHEQYYSGPVPPPPAHMMPPVGHMPMYNGMQRMQIHHHQQQQMYTEPPIPRVITPVTHTREEGPPSTVVFSPSMMSSDESRSRSVSQYHNDFEEVAAPNVSCMNTLFGSSVKTQHRNESRVSSMAAIRCHQLDPSTAELELSIKLPDYYTDHLKSTGVNVVEEDSVGPSLEASVVGSPMVANPMQAFHCNGVRGPGKKFDYSCTSPGIGGQAIPAPLPAKGLLAELADKEGIVDPSTSAGLANQTTDSPSAGQISPHDSFDNNSYLVETRYMPKKKRSSQDATDKYAANIKDTGKKLPIYSRDDNNKKDARKKTPSPTSAQDSVDKSINEKRRTNSDDVLEAGARKAKGSSIKSDRSNGKVDRRRHHVQWDDEEAYNGEKEQQHEGPIFSAKDQAALAKSIREICLERIGRAPSDLDYLEEYPSFDEHQSEPAPAVVVKKKEVHFEDEISSDASGENNPEHANNSKVRCGDVSSRKSSTDKTRSEKVGVTKKPVRADGATSNVPKPSLRPVHYSDPVPADESLYDIEEVASC
jgi:hypothetical protein